MYMAKVLVPELHHFSKGRAVSQRNDAPTSLNLSEMAKHWHCFNFGA
jgi:hypothetical protein